MIVIGTLCLNEMQWLPKLYEQHKNWVGMVKWVFVEAADRSYANANPSLVTDRGLSVDGTTEFLQQLAKDDPRVVHVPFGFADHADPSLCKITARNRYWEIAAEYHPEFVVSVDTDEFYTHDHQRLIVEVMRSQAAKGWRGFTFPRREIWRPPSVADQPLMSLEVVGGFWGIPCCHWWRWEPGAGHRDCHNTPQDGKGRYLNDDLVQLHKIPGMPEMIHFGFAANEQSRLAKNLYYERRGESSDPQRLWYTQSRAAWQSWKLGDPLPRGARVVPYTGPVPECFRVH